MMKEHVQAAQVSNSKHIKLIKPGVTLAPKQHQDHTALCNMHIIPYCQPKSSEIDMEPRYGLMWCKLSSCAVFWGSCWSLLRFEACQTMNSSIPDSITEEKTMIYEPSTAAQALAGPSHRYLNSSPMKPGKPGSSTRLRRT